MPPPTAALVDRFRNARGDGTRAVIEGIHALKHARRFGAEISEIVAVDPAALQDLTLDFAPDVWPAIEKDLNEIDAATFERLSPAPHPTGVMALAARPPIDAAAVIAERSGRPAVLLEDPRTLGNVGATVRVAAAADAHAVLTTGIHDPWDPAAIRGSAGLHWALPVAGIEAIPDGRELIAVDPEGEPIADASISPDALLVFGSERDGISDAALARADRRLGIPIRDGVSSLNLATSVAAVLFGGAVRAQV